MRFRELPVGPVAPPRPLPRHGRPDVRPQGGAARRGARPSSRCCVTSRTLGLPAVTAVGLAEAPERDAAILVTEYLEFSIQYRRLLMRFPLGPGPYRDRLLDAMAWLLVDLHRAGVYWGDCSLANTLFRRDGDKIQAFLVDAETSEIHPALSDGQRALRPRHPRGERRLRPGRPGRDAGPRRTPFDDAVEAAETVRSRYRRGLGRAARWSPSSRPTTATRSGPGSGASTTSASRSTRSRWSRAGGAQEVGPAARSRSRIGGSTRASCSGSPGSRRSRARPSCCSTTCASTGPGSSSTTGTRSTRRPRRSAGWTTSWSPAWRCSCRRSAGLRDPLQAYCDVLEEKWILSELVGTDVGLRPRSTPTSASARRRRRSDAAAPATAHRPRHRLVDRLGDRARRRSRRRTIRRRDRR